MAVDGRTRRRTPIIGGEMSSRLRRVPFAAALVAVLVTSASMAAGATRAPMGVVGGGVTSLDRVVCPDASRCVAAGTNADLGGKGVSISASSGAATAWAGSAADVYPAGLACASAGRCVVVSDDMTA